MVYQLVIVFGYKLTDYTWPILAGFKNFVISILSEPYPAQVPMITDFGEWMVNSANALLNYIPIFIILFAIIAIIEDVGYMPRITFILDRIFKKYGLHGQSTLPLVLGGAVLIAALYLYKTYFKGNKGCGCGNKSCAKGKKEEV